MRFKAVSNVFQRRGGACKKISPMLMKSHDFYITKVVCTYACHYKIVCLSHSWQISANFGDNCLTSCTLPLSQDTDNSWTSWTNCWNKIHKRLTKFCQFFSFAISFWLLTKVWQNFAKFSSNLYLCKIWQIFDEIIDNKVPISQKFHEIVANVLSLVFFVCYHQIVLYRMIQNLNF